MRTELALWTRGILTWINRPVELCRFFFFREPSVLFQLELANSH